MVRAGRDPAALRESGHSRTCRTTARPARGARGERPPGEGARRTSARGEEHDLQARVGRQEIGIEHVHAQLPQDSALVSFLKYLPEHVQCHIGARRHWLIHRATTVATGRDLVPRLVLRPQDNEPAVIPLGSAASLEALVADWRQAMMADVMSPPEAAGSRPSFRTLGIDAAPENLGSSGPSSCRRATRLRRARRRTQPGASGGAAVGARKVPAR